MTFDLVSNILSKHLFKPNETVVLALSGGVDSMVLLAVLKQTNIPVIVAHVNHNKRPESALEYAKIEALCKENRIPFEGLTLPKTIQGNFHHEARKYRLRFFRDVCHKYNVSKVVLGHHLDDQIETFFMRLIKGTTFTSLQGMSFTQSYEDVFLIRPFIDIDKQTLIRYAVQNNIEYFEDSSNIDSKYTRNRYRKLLTFFRSENPQFDSHFLTTIDALKSVNGILDRLAISFFEDSMTDDKINVHAFLKEDHLMQTHIFNAYLKHIDESLDVGKNEFLEIQKMLMTDKNFVYTMDSHHQLYKEYTHFFVKNPVQVDEYNIEIKQHGEYLLPDGKTLVVTDDISAKNKQNCVELCYNNSVFPFVVRRRKEGDWMQFSYGKKKLKRLFIDLKIPPLQRKTTWLICHGDEVLAIPSLKITTHRAVTDKKIYIYEV